MFAKPLSGNHIDSASTGNWTQSAEYGSTDNLALRQENSPYFQI
jgi:hypothetical protein